jgi:hypothetical protein
VMTVVTVLRRILVGGSLVTSGLSHLVDLRCHLRVGFWPA